MRPSWLFAVATPLFASIATAAPLTLQLDLPWKTSGSNTGTVGAVSIVATSSGNRWESMPILDQSYVSTSQFGTLSPPSGTVGDMFRMSYSGGAVDDLVITLNGALTNPVFLIVDIDLVGARVTATPSPSVLTNNADGFWSGSTLTATSGVVQGTSGAFGAIQYQGTLPAGTAITLHVDYTGATGGADFVGFGLYVLVPEPALFLLLGLAAFGVGGRRVRPL